MEISSSNQAYVFLSMILCGALCTVVFDLFRAFRRLRKASSGIIALQDVVFWIIELAIVYIVAFRLNYAKVRAYEIIALVMGSVIYFVTMSEYVIRVFCKSMDFVARLVLKLILPFVKFAKFVSKPFIRLKIFVSLKVSKFKKILVYKAKKIRNRVALALRVVIKRKKEDTESDNASAV